MAKSTESLHLKYPSNLFSRSQSVSPGFIKFTMLEVVQQPIVENSAESIAKAGGSLATSVISMNAEGFKGALSETATALKTTAQAFANADLRTITTDKDIALYMPGSIQINDSLVYETIDTKGITEFIAENFAGSLDSIESFENAVAKNMNGASHILANHLLTKHARGNSILNGFAAKALLASGRVSNPATRLLFRSPNLRQFQVDFKLTPQSPEEAMEIRNIVSMFRQGAYPLLDVSGALFSVPAMWRIRFGFKKTARNPFMIQFKDCFLTNITTSYNNSGVAAFFPDGSPVETNLSLTFQEAELNNAADILGTGNDTGAYSWYDSPDPNLGANGAEQGIY